MGKIARDMEKRGWIPDQVGNDGECFVRGEPVESWVTLRQAQGERGAGWRENVNPALYKTADMVL